MRTRLPAWLIRDVRQRKNRPQCVALSFRIVGVLLFPVCVGRSCLVDRDDRSIAPLVVFSSCGRLRVGDGFTERGQRGADFLQHLRCKEERERDRVLLRAKFVRPRAEVFRYVSRAEQIARAQRRPLHGLRKCFSFRVHKVFRL